MSINLCKESELRELLARHGFHFSKSKGQNFLVREWVPQRIAEEAGVDDAFVLEVGPGVGTLTTQLCRRADSVCAVEVDQTLRPLLAETLAEHNNLEIIFSDVLKTDLPSLVAERAQGRRAVACANLPYYITTEVLTRLLSSHCFSDVTVMIQKEVAQRICAKAGSANYGAFTVFCRYWADAEICFDVPPDCFIPRPKVTSSVIRFHLRGTPPCQIDDEDWFFKVVRASFAQRRKTMVNGLSSGLGLSKEEITETLVSLGLRPDLRGETLDIEGFARVANALKKA